AVRGGGLEIGSGFAGTDQRGSQHNDEFCMDGGQVRTRNKKTVPRQTIVLSSGRRRTPPLFFKTGIGTSRSKSPTVRRAQGLASVERQPAPRGSRTRAPRQRRPISPRTRTPRSSCRSTRTPNRQARRPARHRLDEKTKSNP